MKSIVSNVCAGDPAKDDVCRRAASHALGWGLQTGLTLPYCPEHWLPALVRLGNLLASIGRLPSRSRS